MAMEGGINRITTSEAQAERQQNNDQHGFQDGDAEVARVKCERRRPVVSLDGPAPARMPSGRRAIAASMSGSTLLHEGCWCGPSRSR